MKILVVEDDARLNRNLCRGLREEGLVVNPAFDGEAGEELALLERYDVLILDIMLPLKDGIAVCRSLRAKGVETPILMLTARDSIEDRVGGLDAGADDYLVKPFAMPELLARLRALNRRSVPLQPERLTAGNVTMDTGTHEVRVNGEPVDMTAKEYLILEYLLRHPGMVVSRAMIEEHVWDYEFSSASNLVDVYIGRLRAKLGNNGNERLIETIRGAGYRLMVPS